MATGIKISELPDGGLPQQTDSLPAGRNESTVRIRVSELNNTKLVAQVPNTTFSDLISANIGTGDYFRVRSGATAGAGEVEIFTGNDGNEPIYIRQYNAGSSLRTLTLLDASGYTVIPSRLNIGSTSAPTKTLNIAGDCSITGTTTVPLLDLTQSGTGFGIRAGSIAINTTNQAFNSLYRLTVIGGISASGNVFSDAPISDNRHLTNKKYVDDEINKLNIASYAVLSAANQTFTGTTTFSSIFVAASASNSNYTVTHLPVFIADPTTGIARQVYARTSSDIRTIIGAEPAITTLPVSKGGTGATTFTTGQVLVGNGTGAVTTVSRSGIDTRNVYPTRKHVIVVGGTGAVAFSATHNWDTRDVIVTVYENISPFRVVYPEIQHEYQNSIKVVFSTPPGVEQYRIVVIG